MSGATKREDLLNRMRALSAKTVANGCTEAEAASAADLLGRLLDRYGFDLSDLEAKKEPITEKTVFGDNKRLGEIVWAIKAIGEYCDVVAWQTSQKAMGQMRECLKFFGRESDCEGATYLTHLCYTALKSGWDDYMKNNITLPDARTTQQRWNNSNALQKMRISFQRGMAMRLASRLNVMKTERNARTDQATGKTGYDLVVVKNQVVTEAFAKTGIKLNTSKTRKAADAHMNAGWEAGANVPLNPGIGSDGQKQPVALLKAS